MALVNGNKLCPECCQMVNSSLFYKSKASPDGLASYCKSCSSLRSKRHYNENPDYYKRLRSKNKEKQNEWSKEYYQRNKKKVIKYSIEYARKHRDRDRDKVNAARRKYKENNRDKHALWARKASLKRRFGITLEDYENMLESQGYVCAICHGNETVMDKRIGRPRNLAVDHCHNTGKIRGLLCTNCNTMIGSAMDNKGVLASAIEYLEST